MQGQGERDEKVMSAESMKDLLRKGACENASESIQKASKSLRTPPRGLQERPRAPKRPPRASKTPPRASTRHPRASKRPTGDSETPPRALQEPSKTPPESASERIPLLGDLIFKNSCSRSTPSPVFQTCPSAGTGSALWRDSVVHAVSHTERRGREHGKNAEQRGRKRKKVPTNAAIAQKRTKRRKKSLESYRKGDFTVEGWVIDEKYMDRQ